MNHKPSSSVRGATMKLIAVGAVAAICAFAADVPAGAAGGTAVTVRVEGVTHELLAPTAVMTHSGWITKGGTPTGKCPATSAAGALDVATHHVWGASYSTKFGQPTINSILGETHTFKSKYYWSIWVDNRFALFGACQLTLHKGEQLLFAAVGDTSKPFPIALKAPAHATNGKSFKVTAVWFPAKGKAKPLAGAHVGGVVTNAHGIAKITAHKAGTLMLRATKVGYIRSASASVTVS